MILIEGPANIYYGPSFCCNYTDTDEDTGWTANVNTITTLIGRTENGVQFSMNNALEPVYVDDNGGTEGDPAEYIVKNSTATLRTVIVDYGPTSGTTWMTAVKKLESGYNSTYNPKVGAPIFGNNYGFSLKIIGPTGTAVVVPRCTLVENPRQYNINTSHKKLSLTMSAYPIIGHSMDVQGVYRIAYNYIWHKISATASDITCYDSIGGYNTNTTANGAFNN